LSQEMTSFELQRN